MRLATIKPEKPKTLSERENGQLVVVDTKGKIAALVPAGEFSTLRSAIALWSEAEPFLREIETKLGQGSWSEVVDLAQVKFMAPLPEARDFVDGSAYIQHIILVRKARGAEPPETLRSIPLMYRGIATGLLGPNEDIPQVDFEHGMDFEGEVGVITDHVPAGTKAEQAAKHVKLLLLINDVSLRNLIVEELPSGFGFLQGKPASSFSPFAVTPDELGSAWEAGRVRLNLNCWLNGAEFGHPNAGEMHFSFYQLIEHAARSQSLSPGTIVGSGTVSNEDPNVGSSCLAEKRMLEKINLGKITTPFMKNGDRIAIEMLDTRGRSIFGRIDQQVKSLKS